MLNNLFGNLNTRTLRRFQPIVTDINLLEDEICDLDDDELRSRTSGFRHALSQINNRTEELAYLDQILPEAYALVREASKRVLGMRHFDVQLIGGMVLHEGQIAEMKTGEGKTLVATLPSYLNALTGSCLLYTSPSPRD